MSNCKRSLEAVFIYFHSRNTSTKLRQQITEQEQGETILLGLEKKDLDALSEREQQVRSHDLPLIKHLTTGKFLDDIVKLMEEIKFDLIVMGSHGAGGKEEWFLGSNTQKVVRNVHCDTLVVKYPIKEVNFNKVLFASNLYSEEKEVLEHFLQFIKNFDVEDLHVMTVNTMGFFHQPRVLIMEALKEFQNIASGFNVKTHFYPDYSVEAGIRHFAEEKDLDLVAISNKKRNPLKRIFQGSNVEMLVNHLKHPVLCIDY